MKYSLENYDGGSVDIVRGKDKKPVFNISDYHEQDCCESVYADFSALKDTNTEVASGYDLSLEEVVKNIIGVPDAGVKIFGHFIPCYNEQNGYYSSDLALIVRDLRTNKRVSINITHYVEEVIY